MEKEEVKLLKEIRDALKGMEGYFVYTSGVNTTALENLLKEMGINYIRVTTLMADLYEYVLITKEEKWKKLRDYMTQSGFKAYCSETKLPVSGTIGTIQAIVDKAQVYGFDSGASDWKAIYQTNNALWVKVKPDSSIKAKEVTVGTSAIQVDTDNQVRDSVTLKADSSNTGIIKVGDSTNQIYPLSAGETVTLRKVSLSQIYVIAAADNQKLYVIGGGV